MQEFIEPLEKLLLSPAGAGIVTILIIWIMTWKKLNWLPFDDFFRIIEDWNKARKYYLYAGEDIQTGEKQKEYYEILAERTGLIMIGIAILSGAILIMISQIMGVFAIMHNGS